MYCVFFVKQKTAYEMRISDWSSDVCSSDLFPFIPAWSKNMKGAGNPDFARHQKCRAQGLFTYPFSEQRELVSHLRIVLISQRRRIVAGEAGIAILRTDIRTL